MSDMVEVFIDSIRVSLMSQQRIVILREANGYYVANGRTTHRGVEYDLRWRPLASLELSAAGTYARHRYDFSRQVDGGETIKAGDEYCSHGKWVATALTAPATLNAPASL